MSPDPQVQPNHPEVSDPRDDRAVVSDTDAEGLTQSRPITPEPGAGSAKKADTSDPASKPVDEEK